MASGQELAKNGSPITPDSIGSAVTVEAISTEQVQLRLPEDIKDCSRQIPRDLIVFGNEASAWFCWDMEKKQPRAPATNSGYAGPVQWGDENVSQWDRQGARLDRVIAELEWRPNGCLNPRWEFLANEDPRLLYPMLIVPHERFSPDPGIVLLDFDDVIEIVDETTGYLTKEAWDLIQQIDAPAFISSSKTGLHVIVRGRIPDCIEGVSAELELSKRGKIDVYGYPGDGRVIGGTWAHIEATPQDAVPEATNVVADLAEEYARDDDKISEQERREEILKELEGGGNDDTNTYRSPYFDENPKKVARQPPFSKHMRETARGLNGPHPVHGGTSNDDRDSTNFLVDNDGWNCFVPGHGGGGALHLVAVIEDIRSCNNVDDLFDDPIDVLRTCLAARDKYYSELETADPPTQALRGVLASHDYDYPTDDKLPYQQYKFARQLYDAIRYSESNDA